MEKEGTGKKILVVDDIEDNRRLVGKVMRLHGYEVVGAGSGEDAIKMAQTGLPDLIPAETTEALRQDKREV